MPISPLQRFHERQQEAENAFKIHASNGLIVVVLKFIFGWRCWRWIFNAVVETLLRGLSYDEYNCASQEEADAVVRRMMDVYIFLWSLLLLGAYTAIFLAPHYTTRFLCAPLVIVLLGIPAYRFVEMMSVLVQLHLSVIYRASDPMRAVIGALWLYWEVIVEFAAFFAAAALLGDSFQTSIKEPFLSQWINPLYFSLVTIATIGYGDYSPQSFLAKSIVGVEFFVGFLVTVVVIQRAVAAANPN